MKIKRIILDTNLWISFLISKRQSDLDDLLKSSQVILIYSAELMDEFLEVSQRPKFKKYFDLTDLESLMLYFEKTGEFIKVTTDLKLCRDGKDNFLLNLAVDGTADFLVTGDSDLLEIGEIGKTRILTWKSFIDEL